MKPFRITVVLLALLVLPLFATQALADFTPTLYDVPNGLVGANTKDKPVIGFNINGESGNTLDRVKIRSYIERVYATEKVKLWREDGTTAGFQKDEDVLLKTYITSGIEFDINEEISFLNINKVLGAAERFYITLDVNTGAVNADEDYYHQTGLEVTIEDGYIRLTNAEVNIGNLLRNPGWDGPPPPYFDPYTLVFDTKGPDFDLHVCFEVNTCSTRTYYGSGWTRLYTVDQEDSLRICATNVEGDIDTSVDIHVIGWVHLLGHVSSLHMFGVADIMLECPNDDPYGCYENGRDNGDVCDSCWSTGFRIPDAKNVGGFNGVDADSGHWAICAWAEDTVGNRDTICIEHEDLPWRIDTKKPIIDSVSWELTTDLNNDGKIGLGDCIMIIGWGLQNPWDPVFECAKMEVDWSWYTGNPSPDWVPLDDILEHNRIFRKVFCLTDPVAIDSTNCPVNFLVQAWDNACNYDTLRGEICGTIDLDPPSLEVLYEWHTDYDTMWACLGLGDKALITANVGGSDIVSVTAMMDSAGIDALMQHAMPLFEGPSGVYDTIWTITEPPILYGKDADNSDVTTNWPPGPPVDNDYRVWVTACDDVGNCITAASNVLNKTLDTRRPRPIGFACPDTVPCIHAQSKAGGKIDLYWDEDCDENDAYYYYVWASFEGAPFESIGATNIIEQTDPNFVYWHSEPLEEGYWRFKIKTEDNCSNVGDFSCVVGAFADTTPPHVCIAVPDSGLTFGSWFPVKAVADSESHDVASACLWYRIRPDIENPTQDPGEWTKCLSAPCMYRVDDGYVFTDSVHCLEGVAYIGWVEMIVVACDEVGNCQDTTSAWNDACLVDDDVFRPGRFFFYWDTLAPGLHLVSVNGFPSPQSACGFDVDPDTMNEVVIDVDGATSADSFEVDVRAMGTSTENRIFHQDFVTMPCTIWVSVDGWPEGTQNLYINVKDYDNDTEADLQVELCVPPSPPENCIYIAWPHEWMRIPCTGTSGYNCVEIVASMYDYYQCEGVDFTEVRFQWSPNGIDSWETIADVIGSGPEWSTCWDNTNEVEHGDTVYFRVIAHDEFYMADTSYLVKVFVDCEQPKVKLRIEDLFYTCGNEIPKIPCDPLTLKAVLEDTLIDIDRIRFFFKRHSVPDIHEYWIPIDGWAEPAWSENIWMYQWNEPCCEDDVGFGDNSQGRDCMYPNDYWDIRIAARDIAGHYMYDYDNDGFFDDSTFNQAVYDSAGFTVFLDNEAPQPAISKVCDQGHEPPICIVNPSVLLGGTNKAYVQAGHDITAEISVLPSEDTCEVMKVEWFLCTLEGEPVESPPLGSPGFNGSGNDCGDPIDVNLPDDFPYQNLNTTCGKGNDYGYNAGGPTCLRPYDWAQDIIYRLNVTRPVYATIILDPPKGSYAGMLLTTECPPTEENCIDVAYFWIFGVPHGFYDVLLVPGTYYIMIDNYIVNPGFPNCITEFALYIQGEEIEDMPCVHLGTSTDPNHFPITFNPLTNGLIPAYELEDGWWKGYLRAELYDSLGNHKKDLIELYILDITPSQAVIVDPLNDSYVSGDVDLSVMALNKYHIAKVCYEYKPEGGTEWFPINGGYPNACISSNCDTVYTEFDHVWHTLHTIPDGVYYLRAVATDCDNNVDDNPHTIKVTVNNTPPTVEIEDPRICERTCPDDTVDTLGYVSGTVPLYATVTSSIPVDHVVFMYKNIFAYPDVWTTIGTDYFPTDGKYAVEWSTPSDGRYHVKAVAYTASGKSGESEWMVISVDNSGPFTQIISIDGNPFPDGMDISRGDVIDIELVAIDSTSNEGWTRCYNSGLTTIQVCIENCKSGEEITKCFEVDPVYDGTHIVQWNTSGLEFIGCEGCYYIYVKAYDCLGNLTISDSVKVYVSDIVAPVTTIGGFDGNYIYGYSSENVKTLLFEYADSGSTNWIPIGWSSYIGEYCDYLYKTSWDPSKLVDGIYQIRVISHDTCSNQDDSLAPVAYIHVEDGVITTDPGDLGALSFEKNWCVGQMEGVVRQTSTGGTPVMIARYGSTYECVGMQSDLNYPTKFAGSFNADAIKNGGVGNFFSSVTVASVTYLLDGSFDIVLVKTDLGTHGKYYGYGDPPVEVTIQDGAVNVNRYIWVAPTTMEWTPPTQPDIEPIGDDNGYATYVSFTDSNYCCYPAGSATSCFRPGKYAKIKIFYNSSVETDKEHLAVAWWDCKSGVYSFDNIYLDFAGVEGFNTEEHYVEFAATCLKGPFVVVRMLERPCDGTIVVSLREQYPDITPYSNGYTSTTPKFTGFITDNVQGTGAITQSSITFKIDNQRIYDGSQSSCNRWAKGFGNFEYSGYDLVSGLFRAGWSVTNSNYPCWDYDHMFPAPGLAAGYHMATLTAMNKNIQTCTDTAQFMVDDTPPMVYFEEKCLGKNPEFDVYITDRGKSGMEESGVNKDSVWIYISAPGGSYTDNLSPDQLAPMWDDDSTLHVKLPINKMSGSTNLVVFVYEGTRDGNLDPNLQHGPVDMVGNKATSFWHQYRIDVKDPTIALRKPSYRFRRPVLFDVYDDADGCGIYRIMVDECVNSPTGYACTPAPADSVVYDYQTEILRYYPPASGAWIQVTVKDSAHNTTFLDSTYCVEDYDPPMVTFVPSWYNGTAVCKDGPIIKFVVTDGVAGVNWNTVNVDIDACGQLITYPFTEVINHMQNDTVTLTPPIMNCSDGAAVNVYVYSDSRNSKGPADNGDTYLKNSAKWTYYADASGPTITLKTPSDSLFNRPILFEIKDTKSGLANISVFQDSVAASIITSYAHNPGWYALSPSAGQHKINIVATDSCGNSTNYFIFTKDDWTPPVVSFIPSFVSCKTPTVKVVITDVSAGVDWTKLKVDLYYSSLLLQTFEPSGPNAWTREDSIITVVGNGAQLNLSDGSDLYAVVYSEKSSVTNYTKGPADLAGNWTDTKWITKNYKADCYGPSITWRGTNYCDDSLKFEITDAKSGLAHVYVFEDSTLKEGLITRDPHNPIYWYYTPSEGPHHVDIRAVDLVDNPTLYSFDVTGDCKPPVVTFTPSWINCTRPTLTFQVTDDITGVDWSKVNVDLYYSSNRIQTFTPSDITPDLNGYVTLTGDGGWLGLTDNAALNVVVYSQKNYGTSYTRGPVDLAGNYQTSTSYYLWTYYADCVGPTITWLSGADSCASLLRFEIKDARSGMATITITKDGEPVTTGFYYNDTTQILSYSQPSAGRHNVKIKATDNVGNMMVFEFWSKADCTPPTVAFGGGYISCADPTVSIEVTDDAGGSGVDWGTLHVDLYTSAYRLQTFYPEDLVDLREGNVLTLTADGDLFSLADGNLLKVAVYSYKTSETGYIKGPTDSAGNWTQTQWIQKEYYVDCITPSITWINISDPCDRPVKLQITDNKSGVAEVKAYQDGVELNGEGEAFFYDPTSGLWHLYPSEGMHNIDVVATDIVGNQNTKSFEVKDDCLPPGVKFVGEYVTKNPTVKIVLKDDNVGIDWNTVNVDLFQRDYPYKQCTFTAADIANFNMRHGDTVIVSCIMDLTNGKTLIAYVYAEKTSGTGTSPSYGRGPADLSSNYMPKWQECIYQVDAGPPSIIVINLSERPIQICFSDSGSGIDWSTLEFYEDSVLICLGLACMDTNVHLDTVTGCMAYEPGAGRKYVEIRVKDHAGNWIIYTFWTEEQNLFFTNPHNYPNPFDPSELSTYIDLGLSKSAHVTVKIYDFAGEFVRELQKDVGISTPILWDGKTDDGTEVANGTYLCYIHARDDDSGKIETAVIKITVLKKDK